MKRLTASFLVVLLLGLVSPVWAIPIVTYDPGSPETSSMDWPLFWATFKNYADWGLEWYDGAQWVETNEDLTVIRDYPEPNHVKVTLVFDASHAGDYRLTFAIDKVVKKHVTKLAQYQYSLEYDNMSLTFDWSDAIGIPGIIFTHGVLNDVFWFRMRRDNVPLGAHVEIDPSVIVDSYTGPKDQDLKIYDNHPSDSGFVSSFGQSFTADFPLTLDSAKFYMRKSGLPTGTAYVRVYAHSGNYGTTSVPTGAALASSEGFDVTSLTTSYVLISFNFTGADRIQFVAGTHYCIAFEAPAVGTIGGTDQIWVGADASAPGHDGNNFYYINGVWTQQATHDTVFYVYGTPVITNGAVDSDATFSRDEEGWVNVTVTDTAGVTNIETVTIQVNTTSDYENFTLRWTQATNTFSEVSDPDNICTLNTTRSTRININATTDQICFCFAMTGGTDGPCDVRLTTIGDTGQSDIDLHPAEFTYQTIRWNPIGDLIDSAFSQFGILEYMTHATAFVAAIGAHFVDSIVNLAVLINLQFQVIWQIWGWATGWFTRMITTVLNVGNQLHMILNGTHPLLAGAVDLWTYFNFASAGQAVFDVAPLFFILYWIDSMGKRARTQGSLQVLYGDLSAFANVFAYFMGAFSTLVGFIEGKISWLLNALT